MRPARVSDSAFVRYRGDIREVVAKHAAWRTHHRRFERSAALNPCNAPLTARSSVGDVADDAHHQLFLLGEQRAEADLDGELAAVLVAAGQLAPGAHRPRARVGGV